MRHYHLLSIVVATLFFVAVPSVADACRVGRDTVFFRERPVPTGLYDFEIIEAHFQNFGPEADKLRLEQPHIVNADEELLDRSFIGTALPANASEAIPVYATVTSCTGRFEREPLDTKAYFFGRWTVLPTGRKAFVAGGNWNGHWHF